MKRIAQAVEQAVDKLYGIKIGAELSRPEEKFGDYATNVAMRLAKQVGKPPMEIAQSVADEVKQDIGDYLADIKVVHPGFVNMFISESAIMLAFENCLEVEQQYSGEQMLVEFGNANAFKEVHLGHLYTMAVGDAIAGLLEKMGAEVKRLGYHSDIGMNVAKWIWGAGETIDWMPSRTDEIERLSLSETYAKGAIAFDADPQAKQKIEEINQKIYQQEDPFINKLYEIGKRVSFQRLDKLFAEMGVRHDKRYMESEIDELGVKTVKANIGRVFKESDGAIVYDGEKVGLHTRVFITSKGLPTYESKDLGLAEQKNLDFPKAEKSIIITGNEQIEYFKVMLAALGEIDESLASKTVHFGHGFLGLKSGKMSSRTGNVVAASDLLDSVREAAVKAFPKSGHETYLAAVKYTMLKQKIGMDMVFDVEESVSLEGNSGPYLQYAHARARSILSKAKNVDRDQQSDNSLDANERTLVRKMTEYPDVVKKSSQELMPHHICTYLYELAQAFNRFYEHNRVLDNDREFIRLKLVEKYANILKSGLAILNISAPNKL